MALDISVLNPQQKQAVTTTDKPLLLLAGAGSGKTRVITYRIANLIENRGVPAKWVLALTFTNKAAKEMRERVTQILGGRGKGLLVTTFHSLCVRILRETIHLLGYGKNFVIFDTNGQQAVLKNIYDEEDLDEDIIKLKTAFFEIMKAKGQGLGPRHFLDQRLDGQAQLIGKIYAEYTKSMKACNALDFEDILFKTLEIFQRFPEETKEIRERWRYIMVDEYQDTNRVQYQLVGYLAEKTRQLCVVGDDDQSIYGWRGADIRNILDFQKDFPEAEVIRLEQNYRSTDVILSAANGVISNNSSRMAKSLWTRDQGGDQIHWVKEETPPEELEEVIHHMNLFKLKTGAKWSDFAFLYRSNFQSRAIEEALREMGIPYQMVGGTKFFDRKEIQDCLGYLYFLHNLNDDVSLFRIVNYPRRGIGKSTIEALSETRQANHLSLFEAMLNAEQLTSLAPRALASVQAFVALIQEFKARLETEPFWAVFQALFERVDMKGEIERSEKNDDAREKRVNNYLEFINTLWMYGERRKKQLQSRALDGEELDDPSLNDFLDYVALFTDQDGLDERLEQVSLLTVHAAKGLEFNYVAIIGLVDEVFPHKRSVQEGALEEERRLFYVALTRAKKALTLSMSAARMVYGEYVRNEPSRFLQEIPSNLFDRPPLGYDDPRDAIKATMDARARFFAKFKKES